MPPCPVVALKVRGSILIGMTLTALASFAIHGDWPSQFLALPSLRRFDLDFSAILALQVRKGGRALSSGYYRMFIEDNKSNMPSLTIGCLQPGALSAVMAYVLVMVFDIGGAIYGLGNLAGLTGGSGGDGGGLVHGSEAVFLSAAFGSALGAITGITPLIITAESAVSINYKKIQIQAKTDG
jgi:xanthine/uracil/vitamin C permease (AzgA family)